MWLLWGLNKTIFENCDFQSQVLSFVIFEMQVLHEPGMFLCYSWQCHSNSSCSLSWGEMVCPQKKDWPLRTYLRTIVFSGLLGCRDLRQNSQLSKFRFAFATPCPWFEDLYGHCLNQDTFIVKKILLLTRLGQQAKSGAPVTLQRLTHCQHQWRGRKKFVVCCLWLKNHWVGLEPVLYISPSWPFPLALDSIHF